MIDRGWHFGGRGIRVRGRWKIGFMVDGLCTSRRLTQYLPTGMSTVLIRLRQSFPLLAWWCSILALGHSGITAQSSESGASCHYWDRPGTKKKKKRKKRPVTRLYFSKIENRTSFKHKKKGKTTCRLATNVFSPMITVCPIWPTTADK